MSYELCTTYEAHQRRQTTRRYFDIWSATLNFMAGVDLALDCITGRLDRKFVSAMERCFNEDPDKRKEMKLLKRTVLILVCLGLSMTVLSIKFAIDNDTIWTIFR